MREEKSKGVSEAKRQEDKKTSGARTPKRTQRNERSEDIKKRIARLYINDSSSVTIQTVHGLVLRDMSDCPSCIHFPASARTPQRSSSDISGRIYLQNDWL